MNEHSPYAPPASDVAVVSDRKGAAWKAVSLGLLVDIGGTMLTGIVIAMVAFVLMARNADDQQIEQFSQQFDNPLSPIMLGLYVVGTIFSLLGGYVCARVARHNELKLGGVLAVFSTSFGIIFSDENSSVALDVLLAVAGIAAIMLGSWLGMKRNLRQYAHT